MTPWAVELIIWVSINILIPVVIPLLLLLLPKAVEKTRPYGRGLVLKAVQDGQLFWLTTALCATGSFELYLYLQNEIAQPAHTFACFGIVGFGGIALISVVLVLLHALKIPRRESKSVAHGPDIGIVLLSMACVLLASASASVSHYLAARASESATLSHEWEWEAYASCVADRALQLVCVHPKGPSK